MTSMVLGRASCCQMDCSLGFGSLADVYIRYISTRYIYHVHLCTQCTYASCNE